MELAAARTVSRDEGGEALILALRGESNAGNPKC
jgi:hypothetical protein